MDSGGVHLRRFCLMDSCAASSFLYPPDEQEILYNLVFQSVFLGGILEELDSLLHPLRLVVGGRASAKSHTDAITQRIPGRFRELNCPQTVTVQVPVCVKDFLLRHCPCPLSPHVGARSDHWSSGWARQNVSPAPMAARRQLVAPAPAPLFPRHHSHPNAPPLLQPRLGL